MVSFLSSAAQVCDSHLRSRSSYFCSNNQHIESINAGAQRGTPWNIQAWVVSSVLQICPHEICSVWNRMGLVRWRAARVSAMMILAALYSLGFTALAGAECCDPHCRLACCFRTSGEDLVDRLTFRDFRRSAPPVTSFRQTPVKCQPALWDELCPHQHPSFLQIQSRRAFFTSASSNPSFSANEGWAKLVLVKWEEEEEEKQQMLFSCCFLYFYLFFNCSVFNNLCDTDLITYYEIMWYGVY